MNQGGRLHSACLWNLDFGTIWCCLMRFSVYSEETYVCVYIYMPFTFLILTYTYIYFEVCVCTHIYTHTYIDIPILIYVYLFIYIYVHIPQNAPLLLSCPWKPWEMVQQIQMVAGHCLSRDGSVNTNWSGITSKPTSHLSLLFISLLSSLSDCSSSLCREFSVSNGYLGLRGFHCFSGHQLLPACP